MKRLMVAMLMCAGAPVVAHAHEIHTTHTTITSDARGYTLVIRAFADDLSATVARFSGRTPPIDSSVRATELMAYVSARLSLVSTAGTHLGLASCGLERKQDAYVLCFRVNTTPGAESSWRFGNQMLVELHDDQVNIVQCNIGGSRRTHLFTRNRATAAMIARGVCASG